ncbi:MULTISPECIES: DNA polymerase sliding clamp [Halorussus]|uniref:DNA polymerase sliding clamp n=1 Tax=Halorussus TaxID=1070314 RepID=UPI00209FE196|nr:DNA polymerase sliding clamp [Halorussus vallis]USZ74845.1 DNA polymerase sliding clamp [Halorussus vallis]
MAKLDSNSGTDDSPNCPLRTIVDAETIQTTVELAHALFEECHVRFDEGGLRLSAMDAATVASVEIALDAAAFDSFEAVDGHVGVNLSRLRDVVRMADRGRPVRFALDAETRTLDVRMDELEYTLGVLDPETIRSPPDRPDGGFEFTGEVRVAAGDFERAVKAADMVSGHLALGIDADEEVFYVEAEGDTDDVSLALSADELLEFAPGPAHSLYSLDYLAAINRAMPRDGELDLRLGTEQPVEVGYEFADGAGSAEYLVAPRIARS